MKFKSPRGRARFSRLSYARAGRSRGIILLLMIITIIINAIIIIIIVIIEIIIAGRAIGA